MNERRTYATLEQALNYPFKRIELIIEALTHRSHHHEFGDSFHNERLEFLGDAVLDLVVTEMVMEASPTTDEGMLSKMRSQIVSEASLARVARHLELGPVLRLGKGEDASGGRERDSLLADTFEAVLAAVYLDGGLKAARGVIQHLGLLPAGGLEAGDARFSALIERDAKSRLQELCQSLGYGAPTYDCLGSSGPDHKRCFTMALYVAGIEVIRAEGATKKEATQEAARALLLKGADCESLALYLEERGLKPSTRTARAKQAKARERALTKE